MATVYAVLDVVVKDRFKFAEYVQGHLPTIARYGGRILCRSMDNEVIEGDWRPTLLVIQEWPNEDAFHRWHASEEYRPWREMRAEACDLRFVLMKPARSA